MLDFGFCRDVRGSIGLSGLRKKHPVYWSRRRFLQSLEGVPFAFCPAGAPFRLLPTRLLDDRAKALPELQLHPEYRSKRGTDATLRKVPSGFDDFITEKYQDEIATTLRAWSEELLESAQETAALRRAFGAKFRGGSARPIEERMINETCGIKVWKA